MLTVGVLLWGVHSDDRAAAPIALLLLAVALMAFATAARDFKSRPTFWRGQALPVGRELGSLGMDEFVNKRLYYRA